MRSLTDAEKVVSFLIFPNAALLPLPKKLNLCCSTTHSTIRSYEDVVVFRIWVCSSTQNFLFVITFYPSQVQLLSLWALFYVVPKNSTTL
jgi:hypothetical protein